MIYLPFIKDFHKDLQWQFDFKSNYFIQISLENSFKDNVLKSMKTNEFWEAENADAFQIDAFWLSHRDGSIIA